jgi:probable HAF family extracellular repeat protein
VRTRAFVLENGAFTTIDAPDATATSAYKINDRRQSVFTTIDHPDAALRGAPDFASGATLGTAAFGINNRGQIVGQYGDASGRIHAFLLADGVFTPIEAPGAINTNASDINERGQVVGFYIGTSAGQ